MEDAARRLIGIRVDRDTDGMTAWRHPGVHPLTIAAVERPEPEVAGCRDAGEGSAVAERLQQARRRAAEHIDAVASADQAVCANREREVPLSHAGSNKLLGARDATKALDGGDG